MPKNEPTHEFALQPLNARPRQAHGYRRLTVALVMLAIPPLWFFLVAPLGWLFPIAFLCALAFLMTLIVWFMEHLTDISNQAYPPLKIYVSAVDLVPGSTLSLRFALNYHIRFKVRVASAFLCWQESVTSYSPEDSLDEYAISVKLHVEAFQREERGLSTANWHFPDYRMGWAEMLGDYKRYKVLSQWIVRVKLEMRNGTTQWIDFTLCSGEAWRDLLPSAESDFNPAGCRLNLENIQSSSAILKNVMCATFPYLRENEASFCYLPFAPDLEIARLLRKRLESLGVEVSFAPLERRFYGGRWVSPIDGEEVISENNSFSPKSRD